jgi:biopolymer transport protein ExbB/TolQ
MFIHILIYIYINLVAGLAAALVAVVIYKYYHDRGSRGGWRIFAMGRYAKITEMKSNNAYNPNIQVLSGVYIRIFLYMYVCIYVLICINMYVYTRIYMRKSRK